MGDVNNILPGRNALLDRVKYHSPERETERVSAEQVVRAVARTVVPATKHASSVDLEHPRGGQGGHIAI